MKIISIEIQQETIALKKAFVTALRRVENVEFIRVKIYCGDGSIGIGEAPATKAVTGEDLESISNSIQKIKAKLLHIEPGNALEILHASSIGSSAKAALDIALFSLQVKKEAKSFASYFNIENSFNLQSDITISLGSVECMLFDAKSAVDNSMNILKVKLGSDITHAIEVTKKLASQSPFAKLLIDANQAWTREEALLYIEGVEECSIELIEQPVVAADVEGLKLITQTTKIPILADEATFTLQDVQAVVESKSADMINIKLMKCGGVTKAIEILEYARENGVKCMLGSMLEGPYSINAAIYLAFAYRDVIEYVDLDSPLLYRERPNELDFYFKGATIYHIV